MDNLLRLCVYVFALLSAHSIAGTVIIDFNSIENTSNSFSGDSLDIQGFNFSSSMGGDRAILHWGKAQSYNADQGGATYSHHYAGIISSLKKLMARFLIFTRLILEMFTILASHNIILLKD